MGTAGLRSGRYGRRLLALGPAAFCLGAAGAACKIDAGLPPFSGEVVLLKDRFVSGGAVELDLAITPPDGLVSFPIEDEAPLPGGNDDPAFDADIHLTLEARYAADGIQGGNKAGDFVPYLIAVASIENLDSGERLSLFLPPEVSQTKGFHYGRNVALIDSLGESLAGYRVSLELLPPALVGDPSALSAADEGEARHGSSPLSPGISVAPDLAPFLQGTLFSLKPISTRPFDVTELAAAFTLADFSEAGSGGGGGSEVPTYSY